MYPQVNQQIMGAPMIAPTVVVVNQGNLEPSEWKHGLFDCLSDIPTCCISYVLPCVQYGKNNDEINKDGFFLPCCLYYFCFGLPCIVGAPFRTQLRNKFNIVGDSTNDCIVHCCCKCCALVQEAHEIKHRKEEALQKGLPF